MLRIDVTVKKYVNNIKDVAQIERYVVNESDSTKSVDTVIADAIATVDAIVKNSTDCQYDINVKEIRVCNCTCTPVNVTETNNSVIEEPCNSTPADEEEFMNAPTNVVETIPEGFEKVEELEEAPFSDTYYDSTEDVVSAELPKEEVSEPDFDEMKEKFLKLPYLKRQTLMFREFSLIPDDKKGEKMAVLFEIAVKSAREQGVLAAFYDEINKQ